MFDNFVSAVQSLRPNPPKSVFHYCRAESLRYLIRRDSDIWCTHCNHLNDPEECWSGIRMYLAYLKERRILSESVYNLLDANLRGNSLWNKLLSKDGCSPIMPFSFSFSESKDEDQMWDYTKRCGYRLEFDGARLEQCAGAVQSGLSGIDPANRMPLSFWPCFYEESNRDDICKLFSALTVDLGGMLKAIELDPDNEVVGRRLVSGIAAASPIFKAEKWSYEREWRLVMVRGNFSRIVWRNHRARSYMSSAPGGIRGLLKDVVGNPHGDLDWEEKYLRYELNDGFRWKNDEAEFL